MEDLKNPNFRGSFVITLTEMLIKNQKQEFNFTFNICSQGLITAPIVIYFRKNFFLTNAINEKIKKLQSGGLIEYWDELFIRYFRKKNENHDDALKKMTLPHLIGCFEALACGCFVALLCFLFELFTMHSKKKKKLLTSTVRNSK